MASSRCGVPILVEVGSLPQPFRVERYSRNSMLPTEIWQCIPRYAIAAPESLDPDYWVNRFPPRVIIERGVVGKGFDGYEVETTLNSLRRVCKSWGEYLCKYTHRFLRMSDVMHGKVPVQYLHCAVRILVDRHDRWFCRLCKPQEVLRDRFDGSHYFVHCHRILEQEQPLKAEILEVDIKKGALRGFISPELFPNLTNVLDFDRTPFETETLSTVASFSHLRHLYIQGRWDNTWTLKSPTLVSLVLDFPVPDPSFASMIDKTIDLPALRHLWIQTSFYRQPSSYNEPAWLLLLKVVGKELRTLNLPVEIRCTSTLPEGVWSLCPKLEDLHYTGQMPYGPPNGHPVHTFWLDATWIRVRDTIKYPLSSFVLDWLLDWPGLRTLRVNFHWKLQETDRPTKAQLESLGSIILEDRLGEPYTDFLKRMK
ncbi:hypothetical protein CPB86DRAFT_869027 [Serendipita vermifera]|nr:hypothetical protein CPB86DRAFT_869027 [Serendipita vermifera]